MRTEKTICCKDGKYKSCEDIFSEVIEDQGATEVNGGAVTSGSNEGTIGPNKNTNGEIKDTQSDDASINVSAKEDDNSNDIAAEIISPTTVDNTTSGFINSSYSYLIIFIRRYLHRRLGEKA